jgi:hypothetical protein
MPITRTRGKPGGGRRSPPRGLARPARHRSRIHQRILGNQRSRSASSPQPPWVDNAALQRSQLTCVGGAEKACVRSATVGCVERCQRTDHGRIRRHGLHRGRVGASARESPWPFSVAAPQADIHHSGYQQPVMARKASANVSTGAPIGWKHPQFNATMGAKRNCYAKPAAATATATPRRG